MDSLVGYRYTFQPTPEELVSHYLKKKTRDPAFTFPSIRDVDIYKYHPCELPGLSSIQSDEQVWYFFSTLAKSGGRASRKAKGGFWKITGKDRVVKAKHSNNPIGFKKTLVFYQGSNLGQQNRTNRVMHEYQYLNKDPVFTGTEVVVCRLKRISNEGHGLGEENIVPELVTQQLQDLHLPSSSDNLMEVRKTMPY
ncbi:hypothetical protein Dsin_018311 [Dipteronia sinensis]|uniref:NAC domain-containing protein n=1 Tax=Dipteronia sinensis TaxID=43782 RepID=A0AAE0E1M9_9ROSI|nr:hypothetical protein Dsin_018311 [Dipteronia sinensis]